MRLGIIHKKLNRLEGEKHTHFNLLTWDAKEQIKYLHLNDPEMWTIEKLSDSYPKIPIYTKVTPKTKRRVNYGHSLRHSKCGTKCFSDGMICH